MQVSEKDRVLLGNHVNRLLLAVPVCYTVRPGKGHQENSVGEVMGAECTENPI